MISLRTYLAFLLLLFVNAWSLANEDTDTVIIKQIIADKHFDDFHDYDDYRYDTYNNISVAINDVDPLNVKQDFIRKHPRLLEDIVSNNLNNKFVLPVMRESRVERTLWNKARNRQLRYVDGIDTEGLNQIFDTNDIFSMLISDRYKDFSIYDDVINLDQMKICAPFAPDALQYYEYHVLTQTDNMVKMFFRMKSPDSAGIGGEFIAIRADSLSSSSQSPSPWLIKHLSLMLPHKSGLRHIENMYVTQQYGVTTYGDWSLMQNDVMLEMRSWGVWGRLCYIKSQKNSNFDKSPIKRRFLRGRTALRYSPYADFRDDGYWSQYDEALAMELQQRNMVDSMTAQVHVSNDAPTLRRRESYASRRINELLDYASEVNRLKVPIFILRSFINDYIPTSQYSRFDIQPVTSLISFNSIDGLRLRFGGATTAMLHRRIFLEGYGAYGVKSHKAYYKGKLTYSFIDKNFNAYEFPRRNISFESRYDICNLGEQGINVNHDNIFRSYRWDNNMRSMFFNVQKLSFEFDHRNGISFETSLRREQDQSAGSLDFGELSTLETCLTFKYSPIHNILHRINKDLPVNSECPSIEISHSIGIKALGGDYNYHHTEFKMQKRFFLHQWGFSNALLKMGAMWNKVPYPLLLAPPANDSYINDEESFSLINVGEFLNDRYAQLLLSWETNGNFIGKIPLIKRLRWKEYFAVRALWGYLTSKNNPLEDPDWVDAPAYTYPIDNYIMDRKIPYVEGVIGIHNIFHLLNIDYVQRFTYRSLPTASSSGLRFSMKFNF